MPYAKIEPSGCGTHKNRAKIRLDFFLSPDDPTYDKHHVYVPVFPPEGYPGEVDEVGSPLDQANYDAWEAALPHVWQNNPFHSHFIYPEVDLTDNDIKQKMETCLNYFHTFHVACWDKGIPFIDDWKKVPVKKGAVRDIFVKGDAKDLLTNQAKVQDILARLPEFAIAKKIVPKTDLNIGERGTITIGPGATDLDRTLAYGATVIDLNNAADGDGVLDTFQIYPNSTMSDVKMGTFSGSGDTWTNRDYESIGTVTAGAPDPDTFTGLSCDVLTGDQPGIYFTAGYIEASNAGIDTKYKGGDQFGQGAQSGYASSLIDTISLYGTGTEGGGQDYPISISAAGLAVSATIDREVAWDRAVSAGLSISATVSRALAYARAVTAGLSISATVARTLTYSKSVAANLTANAIISKARGYTKSIISNLAASVTLQRAMTYARSVSANLTANAVIAKSRGYTKAVVANLTANVVISRALAYSRAVVSNLTAAVSITVSTFTNYNISIVANLVADVTVSRSLAYVRSVAANLAVSTAISRALSYARSIASNLTADAVISKARGYTKTITTNLTANVIVARAVAYGRSVAANLTANAAIARAVAYSRNIVSNLTINAVISIITFGVEKFIALGINMLKRSLNLQLFSRSLTARVPKSSLNLKLKVK